METARKNVRKQYVPVSWGRDPERISRWCGRFDNDEKTKLVQLLRKAGPDSCTRTLLRSFFNTYAYAWNYAKARVPFVVI